MGEPGRAPMYVYKVLVNQLPREFRSIKASTIEEAERHGLVILLVGPADTG